MPTIVCGSSYFFTFVSFLMNGLWLFIPLVAYFIVVKYKRKWLTNALNSNSLHFNSFKFQTTNHFLFILPPYTSSTVINMVFFLTLFYSLLFFLFFFLMFSRLHDGIYHSAFFDMVLQHNLIFVKTKQIQKAKKRKKRKEKKNEVVSNLQRQSFFFFFFFFYCWYYCYLKMSSC